MTDTFEWQGRVGDVWAAEWRRTDRSFSGLAPLLDAAILAVAPQTGNALDIGCGAGATSLALAAARPGLSITGVDLSEGLIAAAVARGDAANLRLIVGDASAPPAVDGGYDLAVSRHGVMFFPDPVAAFTAIRARMAPGAPLVFSCFRAVAENPWAADVGAAAGSSPGASNGYAPGPFAFADPAFVGGILADAGWSDAAPQSVDFRYIAGGGEDPVADALDFLSRIGPAARALATLDDGERPAALARLRALLERNRDGDVVAFPAAAWIWSARA